VNNCNVSNVQFILGLARDQHSLLAYDSLAARLPQQSFALAAVSAQHHLS